jgi:multicomponent Na+:H+ antiporter subunit E
MTQFILLTLTMALVYLALTANVEPSNLVMALGLGAAVTALLRLDRYQARWGRVPGAVWALIQYSAGLAIDILRSGIIVARIVLDPKLPIKPGVVAIPSEMPAWGTALSAHAITITPGEMVMEIGADGVMYTHCLDSEASAANATTGQAKRRALLEKMTP